MNNLKSKIKFIVWEYLGGQYVYEKIYPPTDENSRPPRTFFIWFCGIYIAIWGACCTVYELRDGYIQPNIINQAQIALENPEECDYKSIIDYQRLKRSFEPEIYKPWNFFFIMFNIKHKPSEVVASDVFENNNNKKYFAGKNFNDAIFRNLNLNTADFTNAYLKNADFTNTELIDASFISTDLRKANFKGAKLFDVDFTNAYLKTSKGLTIEQLKSVKSLYGAILPEELEKELNKELKNDSELKEKLYSLDFVSVDFQNSTFEKIEYCNKRIEELRKVETGDDYKKYNDKFFDSSEIDNLKKEAEDNPEIILEYLEKENSKYLDLSRVNMNYVSMENGFYSNLNMNNAYIANSDMKNVSFDCIDLSNSYILNSDFTNANLNYVYLNDAEIVNSNFNEASLQGINFVNLSISGVNFINTEMKSADLHSEVETPFLECTYDEKSKKYLDDVNFTNTDLNNADFTNRYILNSDFTDANLLFTVLDGTEITYCDFSKAKNLEIRQFANVKEISKTKLPEKLYNEIESTYPDLMKDCSY